MTTLVINDALHRNLQLLTLIRGLVAVGLASALFYFSVIEPIGLKLPPLMTVLGLMCLFSGWTWWRLSQGKPVSEKQFFAQLCVDMLALALMIYYSGGASNPFISYLLVPIAIGSSILRWHFSAVLAGLGLAAYSLLLFHYVPVHALMFHGNAHQDMDSINLHLAGMWLNFVVSASLIAYFIVRMASTINQQRQKLAEQRENQLESDRLVAVATLAANTAHQLGTPINSISLLAKELDELNAQTQGQQVLSDLQSQVTRCKEILLNLVNTADMALQDSDNPMDVQQYFTSLLDRWMVLHPGQTIQIDWASLEHIDRTFMAPKPLEPTIFNLLNNAAESGGELVSVGFHLEANWVCMEVTDNGRGIPDTVMEKLGQPFNSNKPEGMGIGLYLAINTVANIGGALEISTLEPGTRVQLKLPTI